MFVRKCDFVRWPVLHLQSSKLVFFRDAVEHVVRAARVFRQPGGHLLLVRSVCVLWWVWVCVGVVVCVCLCACVRVCVCVLKITEKQQSKYHKLHTY